MKFLNSFNAISLLLTINIIVLFDYIYNIKLIYSGDVYNSDVIYTYNHNKYLNYNNNILLDKTFTLNKAYEEYINNEKAENEIIDKNLFMNNLANKINLNNNNNNNYSDLNKSINYEDIARISNQQFRTNVIIKPIDEEDYELTDKSIKNLNESFEQNNKNYNINIKLKNEDYVISKMNDITIQIVELTMFESLPKNSIIFNNLNKENTLPFYDKSFDVSSKNEDIYNLHNKLNELRENINYKLLMEEDISAQIDWNKMCVGITSKEKKLTKEINQYLDYNRYIEDCSIIVKLGLINSGRPNDIVKQDSLHMIEKKTNSSNNNSSIMTKNTNNKNSQSKNNVSNVNKSINNDLKEIKNLNSNIKYKNLQSNNDNFTISNFKKENSSNLNYNNSNNSKESSVQDKLFNSLTNYSDKTSSKRIHNNIPVFLRNKDSLKSKINRYNNFINEAKSVEYNTDNNNNNNINNIHLKDTTLKKENLSISQQINDADIFNYFPDPEEDDNDTFND